jgi:hypothetical protein
MVEKLKDRVLAGSVPTQEKPAALEASFAAGSQMPIRMEGEAVLPTTTFAKDINNVAKALGAF